MSNRSLLNQGSSRLRRAKDDDKDPADVSTPPADQPGPGSAASTPADGTAGQSGSQHAVEIASTPDSSDASEAATDTAVASASGSTSGKAASSADGKAAVKDSISASGNAGEVRRGNPNSRTRFGLPPRRRGRPAGPERVALNVRVLLTTDALLTEIAEATGAGPQEVAEAAILHYAAHLRRTGKLPKPDSKPKAEPSAER